jgi:hypothetical protein
MASNSTLSISCRCYLQTHQAGNYNFTVLLLQQGYVRFSICLLEIRFPDGFTYRILQQV